MSVEEIHKSQFFLTKIDAAIRAPVGDPSAPYLNIGRGSRVYLETNGTDQHFFAGILHYIQINRVPRWMFQMNTEYNSEENVYISVPHGFRSKSYVANLRNLTVSANIILELRCFIRGSHTVLTALLVPPNYNVAVLGNPVIFVRLPAIFFIGSKY